MPDNTDTTSLSADHLVKTVRSGEEPLTILKGVSLHIKRGESVAIVGASGSGKSTLLGILAGLDLPSEGEVTLLGQAMSGLDEDQRAAIRAGGVAFVFQNFHLLQGLTALENVMLPLEIVGKKNADNEATELLHSVGLADRLTHYPSQLSGGEQQRVALARAFAGQPDILFADEPTGNLDSKTSVEIMNLFDEIHAAGNTVILVTHEEEIAEHAHRIIRFLLRG